ncbi:MAG: hemolysin III family protein [Ruminococcaceae bacterium]|nr:hemolysin III family protein [Oscillospiraceae bacterium]
MENVKKTMLHGFKNSFGKEKVDIPEREYFKYEEVTHAVTHGIGAGLSVLALVLLLLKTSGLGFLSVLSASVYGISMIVLYSASCAYHASCSVYGDYKPSRVRDFFMKCDHSTIFFLILGTYTPACLVSMRGPVGFTVFGIVASCCIFGFVLNVISVERFYKVSQILYLLTGWTIVVALYPFYNAIGLRGIGFLVLGGILYTVGVAFYKMKNIPNMHIIWHLFVLGGSVMHYVMVYFYCF